MVRINVMSNEAELRWKLQSLNTNTSTFCVKDKLTNKHRFFHVPYLEHVELIGSLAYIFTSSSKVMQLNLDNNGRHFLTAFELLKLKLHRQPLQVMRNSKDLVLEARLT